MRIIKFLFSTVRKKSEKTMRNMNKTAMICNHIATSCHIFGHKITVTAENTRVFNNFELPPEDDSSQSRIMKLMQPEKREIQRIAAGHIQINYRSFSRKENRMKLSHIPHYRLITVLECKVVYMEPPYKNRNFFVAKLTKESPNYYVFIKPLNDNYVKLMYQFVFQH